MKILLIEDDRKIAQFLQKGLNEEGYVVRWMTDGESGLETLKQDDWDLVILDRMLPKMDGLTVCRKARQEGIKTPILILSGKGTIQNRVEGLDCGADDYLPKPFAFSELLARVRALSRRSSEAQNSALEINGLKLDLVTHKVTYKGKEIDLTSREFALLQFFMRRKGHVLSRTIIAESVWDYDFQSGTNVIDVYVNYLRNKLKKITGREMIETVRNRGYVLEDK
jgi:DNA-binding response OmpR family regulator